MPLDGRWSTWLGLTSVSFLWPRLYPYLSYRELYGSRDGHSIITSCPAKEPQLNLEFRPLESKAFPFSLVA